METGLHLTKASRETLLAVIAELQDTNAGLRRRVESLEARLSAAGPRGRMPGHKPAGTGRQPQRKELRKRRPHGFARRRTEPARRMEHAAESCPECHTTLSGGMGAADPGSHRYSGGPSGSHRVPLHGPAVSAVPETAAVPGPPAGIGCRSATPGGQPGEPDCHPAGRGAAARKDNSMVSANVPPVETERWGHRPGRPSGCPAWRNGCR